MELPNYHKYPAYLLKKEGGSFGIIFPDLKEIPEEPAKDLEDCKRASQEALGSYLYELELQGRVPPEPSVLNRFGNTDEKIDTMVEVYMHEVRAGELKRSVEITTTIPQKLKVEADKRKINYSLLLQKVLREELGIEE